MVWETNATLFAWFAFYVVFNWFGCPAPFAGAGRQA